MRYDALYALEDNEQGDSLDDGEEQELCVLQAELYVQELCEPQVDFCEQELCVPQVDFCEQELCALEAGFYELGPSAFGLGWIYVQRVEICADRDAAQPYVADGFEKHHDGLLLRLEYRRGEKR